MRIIFAGDSPSRTNSSERRAFEGARCWPTLRSWILRLGLVPKDCYLLNTHTPDLVEYIGLCESVGYRVVAVGRLASRRLTRSNIPHHMIEHPSGLNRNLNSKENVDYMLKKCYDHLWRTG